jgi:hypothetical protein
MANWQAARRVRRLRWRNRRQWFLRFRHLSNKEAHNTVC